MKQWKEHQFHDFEIQFHYAFLPRFQMITEITKEKKNKTKTNNNVLKH